MNLIDNIKVSFQKAKHDLMQVKEALQEWVMYLHSNQKQMQQKIEELEYRVQQLELQVVPEEYRPR